MERVLQNNLKPATHFIEVVNSKCGYYLSHTMFEIDMLKGILDNSIILELTTIAIFKIRSK